MYFSLLKLLIATYEAQLMLLDDMNDITYWLSNHNIFLAIWVPHFVANSDTSWSFDIL